MAKTLIQLIDEAKKILLSVENEPEKRLSLRKDFYRKYGYGKLSEFGFGNSEIAFLEWEVKRGVLNPMTATTKGSAWWRGVNGHFIYLSTLAQLVYENGEQFADLPTPVVYWLNYLQNPTSQNWYKAHNCSIVEGYKICEQLSIEENYFEMVFVNMVLYRLLFAGALIEGKEFGKLGEIIADPRLPSVDVAVHIPDFYPTNYPLSHQDILDILHKGHTLIDLAVAFLDKIVIMPQLDELYSFSAQLLQQNCLLHWSSSNRPCYCIAPKKGLLAILVDKIISFIKNIFN